MQNTQFYAPVLATLIFILVTVWLIKNERLKENFGVFWITISLAMLLVAVNIRWLYRIALVFETYNIASISYSLAIFFLFLLGLFFSAKMSSYEKKLKNLTQELAILKKQAGTEK